MTEAKAEKKPKPKVKARAADATHRWYVVHVYSGFAKKVAASIRERAASHGLADMFEDTLVPPAAAMEAPRARKVNTVRKFFPGYVLVKMALNDQSWHLVKTTPKVTGFLGSGARPVPMSEAEAQRLIAQMQE